MYVKENTENIESTPSQSMLDGIYIWFSLLYITLPNISVYN